MFLRHHPEGQDERLYEFRPAKIKFNRAQIAEKLYSKLIGERRTWEAFIADATTGSIAARKVVLWLCLTNDHPTMRFEDIPDFAAGEVSLEYSKQELRQMLPAIEKADMIESEKQGHLVGLRAAIADAPAGSDEPDPEPEDEPDVEPGKGDPNGEASTSSETSTGAI